MVVLAVAGGGIVAACLRTCCFSFSGYAEMGWAGPSLPLLSPPAHKSNNPMPIAARSSSNATIGTGNMIKEILLDILLLLYAVERKS